MKNNIIWLSDFVGVVETPVNMAWLKKPWWVKKKEYDFTDLERQISLILIDYRERVLLDNFTTGYGAGFYDAAQTAMDFASRIYDAVEKHHG